MMLGAMITPCADFSDYFRLWLRLKLAQFDDVGCHEDLTGKGLLSPWCLLACNAVRMGNCLARCFGTINKR